VQVRTERQKKLIQGKSDIFPLLLGSSVVMGGGRGFCLDIQRRSRTCHSEQRKSKSYLSHLHKI